MISGTQLKYRLRIPARVTNRMAHGATSCCSLFLLPKRDREIKTKEETREEGKESSFLVRLVFLLYAHTRARAPCKHVYTPCVRIVPHSKSSQGPQPVPSLPLFSSVSSSPFTRPSASFALWWPTRGLPVKAVEIWFTYVIRVSQPPACFHRRNWTVH